MNRTLNDIQRKLIEENHNLIYSFLNSRQLSIDAVEDWYGAAAIGLCKAALAYDENRKTEFTTLAYICMENEVRMVFRRNRKNVNAIISLDDEIPTTDGNCRLSDIIPDSHDFSNYICLSDAIETAANKLSERDKQFLDLIINCGKTNNEIAEKFGVSRQTVSQVYHKFLKSIRECFDE